MVLFVGAACLRLAVALALDAPPSWDGVIYERAARQLAAGEGYTQRMLNPKKPPRPTAFYPVGFPATLAGAYRVLGTQAWSAALLQAIAGAISVAAGYVLARRLAARRAALLASSLHAVAPGPVLMSATYLSEPVTAAGLALALVAMSWPGAARGSRTSWRLVAAHGIAGVVGGLAALARPTALGAMALAGFVAPLVARRRIALRVAMVVVTLGGIALAIAPWALRNARALGAPVAVSTNDGVNLLIGAMDGDGRFVPLPPELDCGKTRREIESDRCRRALALERIAESPLAWIARSVPKVAHTFGYESSPVLATIPEAPRLVSASLVALSTLAWWAALAFAIRGAIRRLRGAIASRRRLVLALVVVAGVFAATHAVFLGGDRYHLPLWPVVAALAAAGVTRAVAPSRAAVAARALGLAPHREP